MEATKALQIIQALADGYNPHNGEEFSEDSVIQHPDTVRALYQGVAALKRMINYEARRRDLPPNVGKPWTQEDENQLIEDFDAGMSISDIAIKQSRTKGGITSRLSKLGKVSDAIQHGNHFHRKEPF